MKERKREKVRESEKVKERKRRKVIPTKSR